MDGGRAFLHARAVPLPDLRALQRGDSAAWDEAFAWLWPAAFGEAHAKLQLFLPGDVEDVAMEALEELVDKVRAVRAVEELKPLVASIAHHRAVSRLRQHFAAKRGSGQTESLEARAEAGGGGSSGDSVAAGDSPLEALTQKELANVLGGMMAELKPPQGELLEDFFVSGLSYEEMAKKHGVAIGSVGVYLKRGLEAMRRAWERRGE